MHRRLFITSSLSGISLGAALPSMAEAAADAKPPEPRNRHDAIKIIADARRIVTPDGVERLESVKIGGIDQWVSVRGKDRRNPVLLHIHGGPGYISIPMSWWFSRDWEEYFTVVQWDQRAAGKTHLLTDPAAIAPTLTPERMIADAEEMAVWSRKQLGQEKIFVTGHSWGSFLGLELAKRHPDWLHAYIGVGQITDSPESERRGWTFAREAAKAAGNAKAIRALDSIAPYSPTGRLIPLQHIYTQRRWVKFYGGTMAYRHGNLAEGVLSELSPDYSDAEVGRIWEGNAFGERYLLPGALALNLAATRRLECPLLIFAGRHDFTVNSEVAADWFAKVEAPSKHLVWFEHSAHLPMTEEPGKYLLALMTHARPLAKPVGDPV